MIITNFGLTCFRLQDNGTSLLIDPYDKKTGLELPRMQNDIILYTQTNGLAVKSAGDKTFIINRPGEYEIKNIFIYGLPATNDADNGIVYLIQMEGIDIVHLGLMPQSKLTDRQKEMLEEPDILMVPVGGDVSLSAKQAAEIINELDPRIVVPMYYQMPKLAVKLDSLDKFKKEVAAKTEKVDKLKINKKDLLMEETKIVVIESE